MGAGHCAICRTDAIVELIDLAKTNLPFLNEPVPIEVAWIAALPFEPACSKRVTHVVERAISSGHSITPRGVNKAVRNECADARGIGPNEKDHKTKAFPGFELRFAAGVSLS
jgi:hypothetical protein